MPHVFELIVVCFNELFLGQCLVNVVFAPEGREVGLVRIAYVMVWVPSLHLVELSEGALELLLDYLLLVGCELELEMGGFTCLATLSSLIER